MGTVHFWELSDISPDDASELAATSDSCPPRSASHAPSPDLHPLSQEFFQACSGRDSLDFFRYAKYRDFTDPNGIGYEGTIVFERELERFLSARGVTHPRDLSLEQCSDFLNASTLF